MTEIIHCVLVVTLGILPGDLDLRRTFSFSLNTFLRGLSQLFLFAGEVREVYLSVFCVWHVCLSGPSGLLSFYVTFLCDLLCCFTSERDSDWIRDKLWLRSAFLNAP